LKRLSKGAKVYAKDIRTEKQSTQEIQTTREAIKVLIYQLLHKRVALK